MYTLQVPLSTAIDAHWHHRLKPLIFLVGETFDALMPPPHKVELAYRMFHESGRRAVPELYPVVRRQVELEEAHDRLSKLKHEIAGLEPSLAIRDAYMERINEMLANVDMIIAAGEKHDKLFSVANKFVYAGPDPAVFAAACAWVRSEASRLHSTRPDMADICAQVLSLVPDLPGDTGLLFPSDEVFQRVKQMHFVPGGYVDQLLGSERFASDVYVTRQQGDLIIERAIRNVGSTFELIDSDSGLWAYFASQGKVVRPPDFALSPQAFMGIVAHEVGSHLLELENGAKSKLQLLQYGLERFEIGNEGRAFLREQIMYDSFEAYVSQVLWHPTKASWEYRIAIHMTISLAMGLYGRHYNFAELYHLLSVLFRFWTLQRSAAIDESIVDRGAWSMCVRALKGTSGQGGAYLKDIVYLEGHVRCWQVARERPELVLLGDVGKFDIANREHIMLLEELGILPAPTQNN